MAGKSKRLARKKAGSADKKTGSADKKGRLTVLAITFIVAFLMVVLLYQGSVLKTRIHKNSQKTEALKEQIANEDKRTDQIQDLKAYMQSDDYLKKTAKDKLGLVDDNEIIFKKQ